MGENLPNGENGDDIGNEDENINPVEAEELRSGFRIVSQLWG